MQNSPSGHFILLFLCHQSISLEYEIFHSRNDSCKMLNKWPTCRFECRLETLPWSSIEAAWRMACYNIIHRRTRISNIETHIEFFFYRVQCDKFMANQYQMIQYQPKLATRWGMDNQLHRYKRWDVITHPWLNLNSGLVKHRRSDVMDEILLETLLLITYPWANLW